MFVQTTNLHRPNVYTRQTSIIENPFELIWYYHFHFLINIETQVSSVGPTIQNCQLSMYLLHKTPISVYAILGARPISPIYGIYYFPYESNQSVQPATRAYFQLLWKASTFDQGFFCPSGQKRASSYFRYFLVFSSNLSNF